MRLQQKNERAPNKNYFFPDKDSLLFDKRRLEKWCQNLLLEISRGNFPIGH